MTDDAHGLVRAGDAEYRAAVLNYERFVALSREQAGELADQLGLRLEFRVDDDEWRFDTSLSGRVILYIRDQTVHRSTVG